MAISDHYSFQIKQMQTIQEKLNQTKQQVIDTLAQSETIKNVSFYLATVCGFIVGIVQFFISAFNENNGAEKLRNFTLTVLKFINSMSGKMIKMIDGDVDIVQPIK